MPLSEYAMVLALMAEVLGGGETSLRITALVVEVLGSGNRSTG